MDSLIRWVLRALSPGELLSALRLGVGGLEKADSASRAWATVSSGGDDILLEIDGEAVIGEEGLSVGWYLEAKLATLRGRRGISLGGGEVLLPD